jgi:hypothetical protein
MDQEHAQEQTPRTTHRSALDTSAVTRWIQIKTVEYTDTPTSEPALAAGGITCPLCGRALPENAKTCEHCDWVNPSESETAEGKASDLVAVMLSVVPGLGHVYKGYRLLGLFFFVGAVGAIVTGLLAATASAGFGLGLIPIYWFGVMFHVYVIKDRVVPVTKDEGEEY